MGNIIAFNPCSFCEKKDMCSMCELQMYREKVIENTEWISVDERLPTDEQEVLVYYGFDYGDGDLGRMYMSVLTFFAHDPIPHFQHQAIGLKVTHWMPLPETPTMKGDACGYVKIDDVLSFDKAKPMAQILGEEYDRMIANDIIEVIKKYFPETGLNAERVMKLAKMIVAEETEKGGAE